MSEHKIVAHTARPLTMQDFSAHFLACGMQAGHTVLVHSSMSDIGTWVVGGEVAVIEALLSVVGPQGTLVMPSHCSANSEPSEWEDPAVPESWWPIIRAHQPAFDPEKTPTRDMGRIAETFRSYPKVKRSLHPLSSFCAIGKNAELITSRHELEDQFGETSPLARIYDLDGFVFLLGVNHSANTSLHLAEHRGNWVSKKTKSCSSAIIKAGDDQIKNEENKNQRKWVTYSSLDYYVDDFETFAAQWEQETRLPSFTIGTARSRYMSQRSLVDAAANWFTAHRSAAVEKRN